LRGFGDDLTFAQWRDRVLYPFSERLDGRGIHAGALLDFAEMLKAGVTTVADFFYLHDAGNEHALTVVEAAEQLGIRVVLARAMYDWTGAPKRYQETPADSARRFHELDAALRGNTARPSRSRRPHSLHAASPEMIQAGVEISDRLDIPFHIHVAEGSYERGMILERHGMSPVAFLDSSARSRRARSSCTACGATRTTSR
jgi:5-methylthioadenosine/S-adenosylhomocysteine deaminase